MLTHGTADTEDLPARTQPFYDDAKAAGLTIELHWCPGGDRGRVAEVCPEQLGARLIDFFGRAFAG